ncbi:V-type proton ATPase subunit S1-like protein [Phyllostomus discolor]|uniref:V-type proton ATPase subunit S1-like protein n=1 Tax=Phyllostomus discolor TaxID=89673 RepID=A0A6J2L769_9CHIR|nr:V-type proton ATPase subunit S1-like protein [Phyllostomus discolor]
MSIGIVSLTSGFARSSAFIPTRPEALVQEQSERLPSSQFYYLTKEGAIVLFIDDVLCQQRFTLTNYNKFSRQSWFSLHRIEIIFNNSIQATFNATGIYAPSSYSYHCQRVSSLQQYDALLLPSDVDDVSSPWEVTFVDFQIQGFTIKGGQFAKARDCAPSFSPAILIGLAMSLILLLVLAYALHMLIYLRYLDRHYDFIPSPARFPQLRARDAAEEKELLRSQGVECYELRTQEICKVYV